MKKLVAAEAEKYILSCIIQFGHNDRGVCYALSKLDKLDFADSINRDVFVAASRLYQAGKQIDAISVSAELGDGYIDTIGELIFVVSTSANIKYYVRLLKEERQRDRIIYNLNKAIEGDDLLPSLEKIIEKERGRVLTQDYDSTCAENLTNAIKSICTPLDHSTRIKTGFLKLDNALGGLEKSTVSLIGAYPSCGKTAFAINIINNNLLKASSKCAFFSLEMLTQQIFERFISSYCSINYGVIREHKLKQEQIQEASVLYKAILNSKKLTIIDDIYYCEEICKAISDIKPDYVVIDFLHCVRTIKKCENRRAEIDYISQSFKQCAKTNNCHIIILCQLSRPEKGVKRGPRMSDLKESGALEQDGDYIIMLNRPYVIDKEKDPTEAYVLIDKNKYGDTGQIRYKFWGATQKFTELI